MPARLQWGRALVSAEGDFAKPETAMKEMASMGPRSGERGRKGVSVEQSSGTITLQWGRALVSAEGPPTSMGFFCGPWRLQWGRALVSAEGRP